MPTGASGTTISHAFVLIKHETHVIGVLFYAVITPAPGGKVGSAADSDEIPIRRRLIRILRKKHPDDMCLMLVMNKTM